MHSVHIVCGTLAQVMLGDIRSMAPKVLFSYKGPKYLNIVESKRNIRSTTPKVKVFTHRAEDTGKPNKDTHNRITSLEEHICFLSPTSLLNKNKISNVFVHEGAQRVMEIKDSIEMHMFLCMLTWSATKSEVVALLWRSSQRHTLIQKQTEVRCWVPPSEYKIYFWDVLLVWG